MTTGLAMEANTESSRQQLLKSLQGHSLHIPDLQALLDHWPQYVNPEVGRLRKDVDNRLKRCVIRFSPHSQQALG